ncbi:hypothetical protein [Rhizobium sp. F40D2]|uniref:hypothetical protein n=1 Tax=Rhizobium sp. F40D2 TaxID=3453141 RepID=UPI003F292E5E
MAAVQQQCLKKQFAQIDYSLHSSCKNGKDIGEAIEGQVARILISSTRSRMTSRKRINPDSLKDRFKSCGERFSCAPQALPKRMPGRLAGAAK